MHFIAFRSRMSNGNLCASSKKITGTSFLGASQSLLSSCSPDALVVSSLLLTDALDARFVGPLDLRSCSSCALATSMARSSFSDLVFFASSPAVVCACACASSFFPSVGSEGSKLQYLSRAL